MIDNYEYYSHTHCFDNSKNPCGLKGKHCCLCDITINNWEKEFDEEFAIVIGKNINGKQYSLEEFIDYDFLKSFISKVEQQACERGQAFKGKTKRVWFQRGVEDERSRIIQLIEKTIQEERFSGAPHALNTLLSKLQE